MADPTNSPSMTPAQRAAARRRAKILARGKERLRIFQMGCVSSRVVLPPCRFIVEEAWPLMAQELSFFGGIGLSNRSTAFQMATCPLIIEREQKICSSINQTILKFRCVRGCEVHHTPVLGAALLACSPVPVVFNPILSSQDHEDPEDLDTRLRHEQEEDEVLPSASPRPPAALEVSADSSLKTRTSNLAADSEAAPPTPRIHRTASEMPPPATPALVRQPSRMELDLEHSRKLQLRDQVCAWLALVLGVAAALLSFVGDSFLSGGHAKPRESPQQQPAEMLLGLGLVSFWGFLALQGTVYWTMSRRRQPIPAAASLGSTEDPLTQMVQQALSQMGGGGSATVSMLSHSLSALSKALTAGALAIRFKQYFSLYLVVAVATRWLCAMCCES